MKPMKNITLFHDLSEIYQLFTLLYPELVIQVRDWHQWGEYTDTQRGLVIRLYNESKLLFSIHKYEDEEGWSAMGCYMVPAYVQEIPETVTGSTPTKNIAPTDTPDELLDIFCRMFPNYQSEIMNCRIWRRYDKRYRGIWVSLRDRKTVLFSAVKRGTEWDASYPILVPAPDEDDVPTTKIDRIIMSDIVIFQ